MGLLVDDVAPAIQSGLLADGNQAQLAEMIRQYREALRPTGVDRKQALWSALEGMGRGMTSAQGTYGSWGGLLGQGLAGANKGYDDVMANARKENADVFGLLAKLQEARKAAKYSGNMDWAIGEDGKPRRVRWNDKTSAPEAVDAPDGLTFAMPTRVLDDGSTLYTVPTFGAPNPLGSKQKTITPDKAVDINPRLQRVVAEAKAEGSEIGKGSGEIVNTEKKQAFSAGQVQELLDEAEKILPEATGSAMGGLVDAAAAAGGYSTKGAKANARLRVIEGSLLSKMPRMEGPQSNTDVDMYRQAAASLANPETPVETRQAALQTLRVLQRKYATDTASAGSNVSTIPAGAVQMLKSNPAVYGAQFDKKYGAGSAARILRGQ